MAAYSVKTFPALLAAYAAKRKTETQIRNIETAPYPTETDRIKLSKLHLQWTEHQNQVAYATLEMLEELGLLDYEWTHGQTDNPRLDDAIGSLLAM